ncbi:MAG: site-specific integrase [Phycisphaerales bacterium]|nr:site-specific integrase [Phycisphaerales bacterium]
MENTPICNGDALPAVHPAIDAYIAHCRASNQARRHVDQKKSHLRKFVREVRARTLADVTLEALTANLAALREAGKSARTCNWRRQIVISWLNWCVKTERIERHPADHAPRFDESDDQRRPRRALNDAECERLIAVADAHSPERGVWYRLALEVGLRRGELARLRWADVDLDARTITVRGSKGKRADTVPLLGDTVKALLALKPATLTLDGKVFLSPPGDAERRADFTAAGVVGINERGRVADLHALRTTLGTRLARRGVAPQVAQKIMRHRDYATTLRYYTDLQVEDMRNALRGACAAVDGELPFIGWLDICPIPLSDPHRRAISGLLAVG